MRTLVGEVATRGGGRPWRIPPWSPYAAPLQEHLRPWRRRTRARGPPGLHKPLGSLALIGTALGLYGANTPRPDKAGPPTAYHNPEPEPKPPPSDDRPAAVAEEAPEGEEAPADEMEA